MLRIRLERSPIGQPEKQRAVLRGMGLRKRGRIVCLANTPEINGMIKKVRHLVSVEEVKGDPS